MCRKVFDKFHSADLHYARSYFLPGLLVVVIRTIMFLWAAGVIAYSFYARRHILSKPFLTDITLVLTTVYLFLATVWGYTDLRSRTFLLSSNCGAAFVRGLRSTTFVLYEVLLPTTIVVDLVFWTVLYPGIPNHRALHPVSLHAHGINIVWLGTEFLLSTYPFYLTHMVFFYTFALVYMIIQFTYWVVTSDPIYSVMDWSKPIVALWFTLILGVTLMSYFSCFLLTKLRNKCLRPRSPLEGDDRVLYTPWEDTAAMMGEERESGYSRMA